MRKSMVMQLVAAAAAAAAPGLVFAGGDEQPAEPVRRVSNPTDHSNVFGGVSRLNLGRFALQQPGLGGSDADGNFTWVGPSGGSWINPANWSPNTGFPDGPNAHAHITNLAGGGTIRLTQSITLNTLNFSDPQTAGIANTLPPGPVPTITMTGAAQINVSNGPTFNPPPENLWIGHFIGLPGDTASATPARPVQLGGTSGLTISGGPIQVFQPNAYTGSTTLTNNGMITINPGASLNDAFGSNIANSVVLNNGRIFINRDTDTMNRPINIGAGGGTIFPAISTGSSTHTFEGEISGSGPLVFDGRFGGQFDVRANNPFTGTVRIMPAVANFTTLEAGTNTLSGDGGFANASSVTNSGTLILDSGGANRLPDAGAVNLRGGALVVRNQETVGSTNLQTASPAIIAASSSSIYNGGTLNRGPGTGLEVRGDGVGTGGAQVRFSNGTALLVNGVIPFAYGHNRPQLSQGIESPFTELFTYGTNGMTPVSAPGGVEYVDSTFTGAGATSNVRLRSGFDTDPETIETSAPTSYTVPAGGATMNSLVLSPGFDADNTSSSNGLGGITVGGGTINLTGGVLLSGSSGVLSGALQSGTGNIINAAINAGSAELILASPGALTMNGKVSGSGGMTKTGTRTLFMNNPANDYTGITRLTGFNRHKGDLISGQPSAYGASTTPIELVPFDRFQNDPVANRTGAEEVVFTPDSGQGETTMTRALIVREGGLGNYTGAAIRNASTGTFHMNGPITVEANADLTFQPLNFGTGNVNVWDVNGVISGAGRVGTELGGDNLTYLINLNGANTFSGGFDLKGGGTINVGNDSAFGTGLIAQNSFRVGGETSRLVATGGARTIANPITLDSGTFSVQGTNPFVFSGNVFANGAVFDVVANNTAAITGSVKDSDFIKTGGGTASFAGNNTTDGIIQAGVQTSSTAFAAGGMLVYRTNTAAGTAVGSSTALGADSTIAVDNNITLGDEQFNLFNADGVGNLGGLRSLTGTNSTAGRVISVSLYQAEGSASPTLVGQRSTIGVDSGTFTVGRSISTEDIGGQNNAGSIIFLANSIGVRKVGAGVLNVGSESFTATRSNGASSTFNGSIVATGSLEVAQGRVRMSPSGAGGKAVSQVGSVALGAGAQLDLTNNALVVDYEGASPLADVRSKIVSGYAGGAWTGPGIMTSMGNANQFALGYAEATAVLSLTGTPPDALFHGAVVDNTSILVVFTRYGDADLSGTVNLQDFNRLAANFGTGTRWDQGDFDYDGAVNLQDFNRLAANFGQSAAGASVTPQDWANLASAIPEPSSLALAGVGAAALLRRRRRA